MTEELVWAARLRTRNALRVLIVGVLLAVAGAAWLFSVRDFKPTVDYGEIRVHYNYDPRLLSGALLAVGGLIALGGGVMLARGAPSAAGARAGRAVTGGISAGRERAAAGYSSSALTCASMLMFAVKPWISRA